MILLTRKNLTAHFVCPLDGVQKSGNLIQRLLCLTTVLKRGPESGPFWKFNSSLLAGGRWGLTGG